PRRPLQAVTGALASSSGLSGRQAPHGMSRAVTSTTTLTAPRNPAQADKRVDRYAFIRHVVCVINRVFVQMTESFAELFEASQSHLAKLKPGAIVTGTVVQVR